MLAYRQGSNAVSSSGGFSCHAIHLPCRLRASSRRFSDPMDIIGHYGVVPLIGKKSNSCRTKKWQLGVFSVEFGLVMLIAIMLFAFVGEFLRISMVDQALATATHAAARAVATSPTGNDCHNLAGNAIQNARSAEWILDKNGDGTVAFDAVTGTGWPMAGAAEITIAISWDDDPADATGVDWSDATGTNCGGTDSWLRVRTRIAVDPWFGLFRLAVPNGIVLRHESWARNNRL